MLARSHLFSWTPGSELGGAEDVRRQAGVGTAPKVNRVVIVGNKISPGNPVTKPDGTVVRTLWGELAWQLGFAKGGPSEARQAFERVRADAELAPSPGPVPRLPLAHSGPSPFLVAAAKAMQLEELRVGDTGLDPVTAEREQWDDGNNTLAVSPGLVVAYERNVVTNQALEAAGIEVIRIAGSELGSGRGGPRCMSCPVLRDSLTS